MKKINKLKDHQVLSWAASTNCSAAVTTEGKLFMFGKVDEDIIDKTTGLYTKSFSTSLFSFSVRHCDRVAWCTCHSGSHGSLSHLYTH